MEERPGHQFKLRLPEALRASLEKLAASSNRSTSAEIVLRLEQSLRVGDVDRLLADWQLLKAAHVTVQRAIRDQGQLIELLTKAADENGLSDALAVEIRAAAQRVRDLADEALRLPEIVAAKQRMALQARVLETVEEAAFYWNTNNYTKPDDSRRFEAAMNRLYDLQQQLAALQAPTTGAEPAT